MSYPAAVTTFATASGSEVLGSLGSGVGLAGMLNVMGTDLNAVETKLGTGSSTPAANKVLLGTGAGASVWQQLSSSDLAGVMTDETGSGALVFANSPTIVTPTIASFANAAHDHSNSAGGGQISNTGISGVSTVKLANPYKFRAYRASAWTSGNGAFGLVTFDTKTFDTGTNYDTSTGKFTAPANGFYQFSSTVGATITSDGDFGGIALHVNGAEATRGVFVRVGGGSNIEYMHVSGLLQLSTNDYVQVNYWGDGGAGQTGSAATNFSGFLVSAT